MVFCKFHSKVLAYVSIILFFLFIGNTSFSKPASQDEQRASSLYREGVELYRQGEYTRAIGKFSQVLVFTKQKSMIADTSFYLSLCNFYLGEMESAREWIKRVIEAEPGREVSSIYPSEYRKMFDQVKREVASEIIEKERRERKVEPAEPEKKRREEPVVVVVPSEKKGGGKGFLWLLGGLVIAGGVAAYFLLKEKDEGEAAPATATGSIQVNSTPTGARVYLDGGDTGQVTNCTLTNVSVGNHTVKIVKEGYVDFQQSVSVAEGQTATLNAPLTKHTITINTPKSTTVWEGGDVIQIKWQTSGSLNSLSSSGIDATLNPRSHLSPLLRLRNLRSSVSLRNSMNQRRGRKGINPSRNSEGDLDVSHRFQDAPQEFSTSTQDKNLGGGVLPLPPNLSPLSSRFSNQKFQPLGDMKALIISNAKIELLKGNSTVQTIASSTANDGSFTWEVPKTLAEGSNYKVKISCVDESSVSDKSDKFTIGQKSITVTDPTASTIWAKGQKELIEWTTKGTIKKAKIELFKANTQEKTIVPETKNDGQYNWTVSKTLDDGKNYKVRVSSTDDPSIYGESEKFEISGTGKIKVISHPLGANVYLDGEDTAKKTTCTLIDVPAGDHTVKLEKAGYQEYEETVTVESGKTVTIEVTLTKLELTITSPKAGDIWGIEEDVEIKWTGASPSSNQGIRRNNKAQKTKDKGITNVKLELYKGATVVRLIADTTENDGSFTWTVYQYLDHGLDFQVKISAVDTPSIKDKSEEFIVTKTKYEDILAWGSQGTADGQFKNPHDISVDQYSRVYVTDWGNHRVQKFYSSGTHIKSWGSFGSGCGQFKNPRGIAVDDSGDITVVDYNNSRIQKFDKNYNWKWTRGSWGSGNGQFKYPYGAGVDSAGYIYVADNSNHRIQKFEPVWGWYQTQWGSEGTGNGQFKNPTGVAIDSEGNVYVADYNNHRIQKFNSGGTLLMKWGSEGTGNGQFKNPYTVAIDKYGFVYVNDRNNHRIQKFTPTGKFICKWGSFGTGYGEFKYPYGLAVDKSGYVYVGDCYNHRVQRFR